MGDVVSARQRGKYMGYFGVVFGVTNVAGPLLGGFFTEHLSWRWIFYINLPLGILALFVVAAVLHLPVKRVPHKIDWAGTAFLSVGVTCIILITSWAGSEYAWGSSVIIGTALVAVASLGIFCFIETKAAEPIIPLWLFKNRTFTATSAVGFIIGFSMFGAIIYLPLYLQIVHGASPTLSGLELLPMIGGMLLTFISSGRIVTRTGRYKVFPIVGTAVLSVGLLLLTQLGPHTPYGEVAIFMFITGLGIGLVMQVLVVAVQNAVPYSALGVATATSTFFRTIGGAFGVAILGAVFANRLISQLKLHATAAELKLVSGSSVTANPAQINHLPPAQRTFVVGAFSHSVETAFLVAVPFVILGFILSWLIKEIPLRTTAFVATHRPDGQQPQRSAAAGDAGDQSSAPTPGSPPRLGEPVAERPYRSLECPSVNLRHCQVLQRSARGDDGRDGLAPEARGFGELADGRASTMRRSNHVVPDAQPPSRLAPGRPCGPVGGVLPAPTALRLQRFGRTMTADLCPDAGGWPKDVIARSSKWR